MSPRPTKYPQELREHAIRMFAEERLNYPSEAAAIRAVADRLGIRSPDTLRKHSGPCGHLIYVAGMGRGVAGSIGRFIQNSMLARRRTARVRHRMRPGRLSR